VGTEGRRGRKGEGGGDGWGCLAAFGIGGPFVRLEGSSPGLALHEEQGACTMGDEGGDEEVRDICNLFLV